ncbi:MAG: UDP-glucose/GDP-mannose dehydrogenase family protein [Lutisporaceae bacterium]
MMMLHKITIFGLGFVGLTTALGFAEKGHSVFGFDVDSQRTAVINSGNMPFLEPGLDTALVRHLNNNFTIVENPAEAVRQSDFVFVCVGTPCGENGEADLKYIYSALDMFSSVLDDGNFRTIVIKSTIPPSTSSERIIPYLSKKGLKTGEAFGIANNPEFLREGSCWEDFMNADRIVCGVDDDKSAEMLLNLYKSFSAPFFTVSLNTGEFIKYLSNTLLATMISYSNEMSKIADTIGNIQIKEAFKILHMDKRWGNANMKSYVYPGCGYGGYCLPKDTQAMYAISTAKGYEPNILKSVIDINQTMPEFMVEKIKQVSNSSEKIGILGLSFKPESDDVRDSASAKIIKQLNDNEYYNIIAYDPVANDSFKQGYADLKLDYSDSLDKVCQIADVIIIATAWKYFVGIDKKYPDKKIVDCRYLL